jgi:xanthosine utilization system XapX-like protein
MKEKGFWSSLADNALLVITLIAGILTAILYPLNLIPQTIALSVIVGLLTLLATSEILQRRRRFAKVESLIESGFEKLTTSLSGVEVQRFESEKQTYDYLINRLQTVQGHIKDVSLGIGSERVPEWRKKYYENRSKILKRGKVHYRYVTVLKTRSRLDMVRHDMEDLASKQYYVGYFDSPENPIPGLGFIIIDDKEVLVGAYRRLHNPSENNPDLLIKHPDIVRLFSDYFELLWTQSTKLNDKGIRYDLLDSIKVQ